MSRVPNEQKQQAMHDAALTLKLKRRIDLLLSLPLTKHDNVALEKSVRETGQQ